MVDISVILNHYKRTDALLAQIDCVKNQSLPPTKIYIWNNGANIEHINLPEDVMVCHSSSNLGVWARFAFALNAETEYICLLDDDTLPGRKFFQNCMSSMRKRQAVYGARGLIFETNYRYEPYQSFGWDNPNDREVEVDIIGHAWFLKRDWLTAFWRELPPLGSSRLVGEDMHLSFMLRKYLGVPSIIPPHPVEDQDLWGSNPTMAISLGQRNVGISANPESLQRFSKALQRYTSTSANVISGLEGSYVSKKVYLGLAEKPLLQKIALRSTTLRKLARKIRRLAQKVNIEI